VDQKKWIKVPLSYFIYIPYVTMLIGTLYLKIHFPILEKSN